MTTAITPSHQWTTAAGRVLLLKCVKSDGASYGNFLWPKSGPVKPLNCKPDSKCDTGGLFGWPNALGVGAGKTPDYAGRWIVFSAPPSQVFMVESDGKAKVAAETPDKVDAIVEYCGTWWGAMAYIAPTLKAGTIHASSGAASNSGSRGAASNSGDGGIACTTGELSTIEATKNAFGASTATEFYWKARPGAVIAVRWFDAKMRGRHVILLADKLKLKDGQIVKVVKGKVKRKWVD